MNPSPLLTEFLQQHTKKTPEKKAAPVEKRDLFNEHIRLNGFPRFLSYAGERRDN